MVVERSLEGYSYRRRLGSNRNKFRYPKGMAVEFDEGPKGIAAMYDEDSKGIALV